MHSFSLIGRKKQISRDLKMDGGGHDPDLRRSTLGFSQEVQPGHTRFKTAFWLTECLLILI